MLTVQNLMMKFGVEEKFIKKSVGIIDNIEKVSPEITKNALVNVGMKFEDANKLFQLFNLMKNEHVLKLKKSISKYLPDKDIALQRLPGYGELA